MYYLIGRDLDGDGEYEFVRDLEHMILTEDPKRALQLTERDLDSIDMAYLSEAGFYALEADRFQVSVLEQLLFHPLVRGFRPLVPRRQDGPGRIARRHRRRGPEVCASRLRRHVRQLRSRDLPRRRPVLERKALAWADLLHPRGARRADAALAAEAPADAGRVGLEVAEWAAPVAVRDDKAQKSAASIRKLRFCYAIQNNSPQKSFLNLDSGLTNS